MGSSEKQLECMICLSDFHADFAHIPELDCSCTIIVHEECWEQWSGYCLYCRNTDYYTPNLNTVPVNRRIELCTKPNLIYLIWAFLIFVYSHICYTFLLS